MRNKIIECAKRYDADVVGFASCARFSKDDPIFQVFPETKTVIGLGFRVLRGIYRGVEEGTTYYQYTTMGVENLEETVMPLALINVSNLIEDEGFEAVPQRRNQLIMNINGDTNPEVDYTDIYRGIEAEHQIDFLNCAVQCGLGEKSMINSLLNKDYGPFIRYCFILTDAELEETPLEEPHLCDRCGECINACPGKAIAQDGATDNWRCAVYYNGANGTKNPFMPPEAFSDFENRMDIINGTAQFSPEEAKNILDNIYFYPPAKHFYRTSICGRACDRACYIHLEEKGILGKSFVRKFRNKEDWKLSTKQFETGKREKEWALEVEKMKEKIKIAVIGCGRFSGFFIPLWKAHRMVEKVYVCDLIKERAEQFSKEYGVEIIESFEAALASDEINSIAIFTQRFTHGEMAIRALKAGKHVYSSVPCAISVDEIIEIERLVRETRLTYSMGETGFYRGPTIFCRREYAKGTFGTFTYAEAHYNHDIRNMENAFRSSGGDDWKKYAGIPPMHYPTHSTAMILGSMPGVYAKKVMAFGFRNSPRTDIYGTDGQNLYNNPFANTAMLLELSNGGIARVSENRCIGWFCPETYISQFYGSEGGYEFSVARHHLSTWDPNNPGGTIMRDVTKELQPPRVYEAIEGDYAKAIQEIANGAGFTESCPIQPLHRVPPEFEGLDNRHNGTHHFLIDDFCRAYETGKLSPCNIWQVARFNIPGLMAHESALRNGETLDVIDLGDPPEDWEVLTEETMVPYEVLSSC